MTIAQEHTTFVANNPAATAREVAASFSQANPPEARLTPRQVRKIRQRLAGLR